MFRVSRQVRRTIDGTGDRDDGVGAHGPGAVSCEAVASL